MARDRGRRAVRGARLAPRRPHDPHDRPRAPPNGARPTATIAESPALTWPPADSDSVRALVEAASDLELALVSAGWTPVAPGRAWYAKRFAWEPPSDAACTLPASEIA